MVGIRENENLDSIAKHVSILNEEVGEVKINVGKINKDICWLKKIMGYMASLLTLLVIASIGKIYI